MERFVTTKATGRHWPSYHEVGVFHTYPLSHQGITDRFQESYGESEVDEVALCQHTNTDDSVSYSGGFAVNCKMWKNMNI